MFTCIPINGPYIKQVVVCPQHHSMSQTVRELIMHVCASLLVSSELKFYKVRWQENGDRHRRLRRRCARCQDDQTRRGFYAAFIVLSS